MINMDDVARLSGVSKSTVSRVLNRNQQVSKPKREKVIEACKQLGYRLNFGIQDLILRSKNGAARNIALVMIDAPFNSSPYLRIINALIQAANELGYHLIHAHISSDSCESMYDLPAQLRDERADGMFLLGDFSEKISRILSQLRIPGVFLGCCADSVCSGFGNVSPEFYTETYQAVSKLIEKGAKRIAYIEEGQHLISSKLDYSAFSRVCYNLFGELDESLHYVGNGPLSGMLDIMTPVFMERKLPFDAMYCPDERIGIEMDKLNFMHSKLFSVPEIPLATEIFTNDSVLENIAINIFSSPYSASVAFDMLCSMMGKRPCALKVQV